MRRMVSRRSLLFGGLGGLVLCGASLMSTAHSKLNSLVVCMTPTTAKASDGPIASGVKDSNFVISYEELVERLNEAFQSDGFLGYIGETKLQVSVESKLPELKLSVCDAGETVGHICFYDKKGCILAQSEIEEHGFNSYEIFIDAEKGAEGYMTALLYAAAYASDEMMSNPNPLFTRPKQVVEAVVESFEKNKDSRTAGGVRCHGIGYMILLNFGKSWSVRVTAQ